MTTDLDSRVGKLLAYKHAGSIPKNIFELPSGTTIGINACTNRQLMLRWFRPGAEVYERVTGSDLARAFLSTHYKLPTLRRRDQRDMADAVVFAKRGALMSGAYVDISKAYWAVWAAWGHSADYRLGAYLSRPEGLPALYEFLTDKRVYASAVSHTFSPATVMQHVRDGRLVTTKTRNVFHQPCVAALVRDILAGVYSDLFRTIELHYAMVDGFIVSRRDAERAVRVIEDWGLRASVKRTGAASVRGVGSYSIGGYETHRLTSAQYVSARMSPAETRWLRERVAKHLSRSYALLDEVKGI